MRARRLLALAPMLLAGCTVGPHYKGPPDAAPHAASSTGFVRTGAIPVKAGPPVARWWETLNDPTLDTIETRALAANPDLIAAIARIRQARAALREEKSNLLPSASGSALYAHASLPGVTFAPLTQGQGGGGSSALDIYNLGFNASWEVDLFGGERRAIEAAKATAAARDADLADAQVALTADIANAYLNIRDRQRRIALVTTSVDKEQQMLTLTRQRFDKGTASRLDVERLTQQLENTRAGAIPLRAELAAFLNQIATLIGEEPGALDATLAEMKPIPLPPAEVAIGDPAALLQRRPDIRAAERTLAADTAKIGQSVAARFPRVSMMGLIGIGGSRPGDVFDTNDITTLIAPQLSWSFLDWGKNLARVHQAEAVRDEAEAKYRKAVLMALRDAEDSLARFDTRRRTLVTLLRVKASADEAARLSRQRYEAGTSTLIDLLDAQRTQIAAEENVSQAQVALTSDYVAINKALGLGWGTSPSADQPKIK